MFILAKCGCAKQQFCIFGVKYMLQAEFLSVIDASRCVGKVRFRRLKRAIERPIRAGYDDDGNGKMVLGEMVLEHENRRSV